MKMDKNSPKQSKKSIDIRIFFHIILQLQKRCVIMEQNVKLEESPFCPRLALPQGCFGARNAVEHDDIMMMNKGAF